jgi:hypothetical protein
LYKTSRHPQFLDNMLTDGGEFVGLTGRKRISPRKFLVLISVRGSEDPRAEVRLEGLSELKTE